MENKIVGAIFCFMSAILISARYISAAIFMSGVVSWDATLFAAGLEYVGPFLPVAAGVAFIIGILFLGYALPDKPASDITSDDVASAVAFYMGQATDLNDKGLTMVHELAKYIFDNSASEERSDDHW